MTQQILLSGVDTYRLFDNLRSSLKGQRPEVIAVAAAFVSTEGVHQLAKLLGECGIKKCRLIAGIDNAITHPEALYDSIERGWEVRLGTRTKGIFHPKLMVAGQSFTRSSSVRDVRFVYVGSSNLTAGGLGSNVECGLIAEKPDSPSSASDAFSVLWRLAIPATEAALRDYAAHFAERARRRTAADLIDLGLNDLQVVPKNPNDLINQPRPTRPALKTNFAVAAWTGLQSFTGQYRFQVEFPRDAGRVLSQLVRGYASEDGHIDVYCPDDENTRQMQFRFYPQNGMFRLNVPNDVAGVDWVRKHKEGLAIVEQGPAGGAPLRIRFLMPGTDASEIVGRSAALGTWGKTSTRAYGWY